jgi:hypothetical protein
MKYLVKGERILTTENWEERNTTYKKIFDKDGNEILIAKTISIEDYAKENGFKIVNTKPKELVSKELKVDLENELQQIKKWFLENDYKVNKVFIGEWQEDDARWVEYKQQRALYRKRLDEIEKELL